MEEYLKKNPQFKPYKDYFSIKEADGERFVLIEGKKYSLNDEKRIKKALINAKVNDYVSSFSQLSGKKYSVNSYNGKIIVKISGRIFSLNEITKKEFLRILQLSDMDYILEKYPILMPYKNQISIRKSKKKNYIIEAKKNSFTEKQIPDLLWILSHDPKDEFLKKYPNLRKFKDKFSCNFATNKKIKVKYKGKKYDEKKGADILTEEMKINEVRKKLNILLSEFKNIEIQNIQVINNEVWYQVTIYPPQNSCFLPIIRNFIWDPSISVEKFRSMKFEEYDPQKLKKYDALAEKEFRKIQNEFKDLELDPYMKNIINVPSKLSEATEIKIAKDGICVYFQNVYFLFSNGVISDFTDREKFLIAKKTEAKCKKVNETLNKIPGISWTFSYEKDHMWVRINSKYTQIKFFEENFPMDKIEDILQDNKKKYLEKIHRDLEPYIKQTVVQHIFEIIKNNPGVCSKSAIYRILTGKEKSNYYKIPQKFKDKISLDEVEKILTRLVSFHVLLTEKKYGHSLGGYYDVYSLTDDPDLCTEIFHITYRTDHDFNNYEEADWTNLMETENNFTLNEWMQMMQMWNYNLDEDKLIHFWKNAPDPVLCYMKYTRSLQTLKIRRIWKKLLAD